MSRREHKWIKAINRYGKSVELNTERLALRILASRRVVCARMYQVLSLTRQMLSLHSFRRNEKNTILGVRRHSLT